MDIKKVLTNQFHVLAYLLNNEKPIESFPRLRKSIEAYIFYLTQNNLVLNVDLVVTSKICTMCNEPIKKINSGKVVTLNCNHLVCSKECLSNYVTIQNPNLADYQTTMCSVNTCSLYIFPNILEDAFGGKEKLKTLIVELEEKRAAKFECPICSGLIRVDQSITLDCDHRFCRDCISMFIESNVNESKVTDQDLSCPLCLEPIANMILKALLSRDNFIKLEKFRIRNYVPVEKNAVFFKCPGNDCEFIAIVDENEESVKCPIDGIVCCPKCRREVHSKMTCEEYDRMQKDKVIDDEFAIAAKALGFKTCPHCKVMCERMSGCNFMRCMSKDCKGKKNFCLLCEKPLNEKQHYDHYKNKGPFGTTCNFLDGTPDEYMF